MKIGGKSAVSLFGGENDGSSSNYTEVRVEGMPFPFSFWKTLTLITKAPDRPHEVVATAAMLVVVDVGVTGTEVEVINDSEGKVAGEELARLDTPGCMLAAEGVFGRPGTGVSNGSGQRLVHSERHQRERLSKLGRDELITNKNRATAYMSSRTRSGSQRCYRPNCCTKRRRRR